MNKSNCPFCWNERVRRIDEVKANGSAQRRILMECECCERFYWRDSEEPVEDLAAMCETAFSEPDKCDGDVRKALNSERSKYDKRKRNEFDQLCSFCSNRRLH